MCFSNLRNFFSPKIWKEFCFLRNKVQLQIKTAKQNFFENKLEESKGNPKAQWKLVKTLGYSKKNNSKSKIGLTVNNDVCFTEKTVAETFNRFFTSVASKLVDKLPPSTNQFCSQVVDEYYANLGVTKDCFRLQTD